MEVKEIRPDDILNKNPAHAGFFMQCDHDL